MWAWGVLVCVKRVIFVSARRYVKIRLFERVEKVLAEGRRANGRVWAWGSSMTLNMIDHAVIVWR